MKSKKFVLAALVLLAITGLLALAGCKNDTVPETPAAKLVSISVTPSEGTVYKVGEDVVHKKDGEIGVTAHYDNGRTRTVTGTIITDTSSLTQSAGVQTVTVSYSEGGIVVSGQFEIRVLPTILTKGSRTYMEFGEWPQTILKGDVKVDETKSKQMGMFTYYLGSDKNWYVKVTAKPLEDTYTYSDGNPVEEDMEVYFKVEPIVWRVLTTNYTAPPEGGTVGEILLLAESILTGGVPYYVSSYRREITKEKETGTETEKVTVYPNNWQYSTVRAWLNGLDVVKGDGQEHDTTYTDKGFLQTAFTESARKLIADTSVDNSAASTFGTGESTQNNPYVCGKTKDKIFLLSQQEATTLNSGFGAYDDVDSTRIRVTTDYAKATGAYQGDPSAGDGGWWWLRSPYYDFVIHARVISPDGIAGIDGDVSLTDGGVVPALSISLQ